MNESSCKRLTEYIGEEWIDITIPHSDYEYRNRTFQDPADRDAVFGKLVVGQFENIIY